MSAGKPLRCAMPSRPAPIDALGRHARLRLQSQWAGERNDTSIMHAYESRRFSENLSR